MKNIALITAKGGNTTIRNKNLIDVEGKSFLARQIETARNAKHIDEVFVSTECPLIKAETIKYSARIIDRPDDLARAFTNHGDAISHGAAAARDVLGEEIDTVTILLGNTLMNTSGDIDRSIEELRDNPEADSCMTVWRAQDDHPYRAMRIDEAGYLRSFFDLENTDTNRQSYPDVYYYDQGPWTVRYESLMASERGVTGPACWWWMGDKVIPIIRMWVTGKDVHTRLDVEISKAWVRNQLWEIR
jgi:N-acylneuraminate cytidylyltransferase